VSKAICVYLENILVVDHDEEGLPVGESLVILRHPAGGVFGVDESFIAGEVGPIRDPFDGKSILYQENFTDPESNIMKMGDGAFDQAYNGQVAVEESNQIIVAQGLTPQGNDKQQVQPMVEQIKENLGGVPQKLSGDSGFYSEANVLYVRKEGIDDYLCPDRIKHGEPLPSVRGRPPAGLSFTDRVRRKLLTKQGRRTYGLRKQIVEPVFGQIKQARGLRQFLLRGVQKVQGEWSLWCTGHNLLKIWAAVNA